MVGGFVPNVEAVVLDDKASPKVNCLLESPNALGSVPAASAVEGAPEKAFAALATDEVDGADANPE